MDTHERAFIPKAYISNSNERLKMYGLIEEKSKKNLFKELKIMFEDRFGEIPNELKTLFEVMKIKNLASKVGIDKIITKKDRTSFVYFDNEKNKNQKQNSILQLLKKLNENGEKTDIKEKNHQLSIVSNSLISVNKTLLFLKKTKNKTQ